MSTFLFKNFWVAFILVTLINGIILKFRVKKYIDEKPELEKGYNKASLYYMLIGNVPWIIMGIGMLMGYTDSIFDFFRPQDYNPIVLIFHASIILIIGIFANWVFVRNGADFFIEHPGLIIVNGMGTKKELKSINEVKTFFGLMLIGSLIALLAMWFMDIPKINL